jgi:hypothetical protein
VAKKLSQENCHAFCAELEKSCNFNFKLKCVNYALYQFTSKLKSKLLIFKPTKV